MSDRGLLTSRTTATANAVCAPATESGTTSVMVEVMEQAMPHRTLLGWMISLLCCSLLDFFLQRPLVSTWMMAQH